MRFFPTSTTILGVLILWTAVAAFADSESERDGFATGLSPVGSESKAVLKACARRWLAMQAVDRQSISEEFDAKRYDIDLEIFPDDSLIAGSVRVIAETIAPAETLWLHMNSSWLFVDSIVGPVSGWQHADDLLGLVAAEPYEVGETIELTIHYHGSPENTLWNFPFFGSYQGMPQIRAFGTAGTWWPSKDQLDDKADTVTISIVIPEPLIVVSNGLLASAEVLPDGTAKYTWVEGYPIDTSLVFFTAMDYDIQTDWHVSADGDSIPVYYYLYPDYPDPENAFAATVPALEVYSLLFGSYPFAEEKFASVMAVPAGGAAFQTCTTGSEDSDWTIRHEVSHEWWGCMIGVNSLNHIWLAEGFATYSGALWEEVVNGAGAYHSFMRGMDYYGDGTVYVEDPDPDWDINMLLVYIKAAYVLHMLRHVVEDNHFFEVLLHYRQLFEYSTATTEGFQHAVEDIWGDDLSWFFEQWIYWEYYPYYEYGWTCTERNQPGWLTTVEVRQIQTNTGPFKMPMDLKLTMDDGSEETHVVWVERTFADSFYFETASQVTGIELDPDNWVLCEKREVSLDALDHPIVADVLTIDGPWPNPASGYTRFNVRLPTYGDISLYDIAGRLIYRNGVEAHQEMVTLRLGGGDLGAGTYVVRLATEDRSIERRLVVRE